jgi:hypothetical protein
MNGVRRQCSRNFNSSSNNLVSLVHSFPSLMQPKNVQSLSFILNYIKITFNYNIFRPSKAETELSERVIYQCNKMPKYNIMNNLSFISIIFKRILRIFQ